jgi:hypothetical protein
MLSFILTKTFTKCKRTCNLFYRSKENVITGLWNSALLAVELLVQGRVFKIL